MSRNGSLFIIGDLPPEAYEWNNTFFGKHGKYIICPSITPAWLCKLHEDLETIDRVTHFKYSDSQVYLPSNVLAFSGMLNPLTSEAFTKPLVDAPEVFTKHLGVWEIRRTLQGIQKAKEGNTPHYLVLKCIGNCRLFDIHGATIAVAYGNSALIFKEKDNECDYADLFMKWTRTEGLTCKRTDNMNYVSVEGINESWKTYFEIYNPDGRPFIDSEMNWERSASPRDDEDSTVLNCIFDHLL